MISPSSTTSHRGLLGLLLGLAVVLGGCATNRPSPSGGRAEQAGFEGRLVEGRGAPWTILCIEVQGPNRRQFVVQLADALARTSGIRGRDVVVQDEPDGFMRLYYGVYYRKTDPETGRQSVPAKLDEDLKLIKGLGGGPNQQRYFLQARKVRVPMPDAGNPDWELRRAKGRYSLQVAVFEPTDEFWDFKEAAAEYCRELRDMGFEAYYYHGEASSSVTVGVFGPEALIPQDRGLWKYSPEVLRFQASHELLRYNRLNGAVYTARSDTGQMVPVESRLVLIPSEEETAPWTAP